MNNMTSRERAIAVYDFRVTDRPCIDLMEGTVWQELAEDFAANFSLCDAEAIQKALGSDFRWRVFPSIIDPFDGSVQLSPLNKGNYSDSLGVRPLQKAKTPGDVRRLYRPDPGKTDIPDWRAFRAEYPDKALVCCPGWMPNFAGAADDFGMETALALLVEAPEVIEEYIKIKSACALEIVRRCIKAGAGEYCDFFWLGDDFSGETAMLLSPVMWREFFKEPLRLQVQEARAAGLRVMFHSCGNAAAVYGDFIEIGINAHCGVQTSCPGMSAEELAQKIGGRLVIHGGVDAQTTLVWGDEAEVITQTKRNIAAFSHCNGYVVSNSHHGMADIGANKLAAMSKAAGRWME
ncbi:MAG: hypothetical protein FWH02_01210 [Oscillospiraceae bacterium]|nr:hypothetical protein [Oscillospiraceae bacterium]